MRWALPANGVKDVEREGIRALSTGPPLPVSPKLAKARYPELEALPPEQMPDRMFQKLFGAILAPAMLAGLDSVVTQWRPDLVLADAADFAGHIVAAELGIPSVTKGFGPLLSEAKIAATGAEVAGLWRSRGLAPRPYGGAYDALYIDDYPPPLQVNGYEHVPRRQLLQPLRDGGAHLRTVPLPLPEGPSSHPLVYVTMGTVFNDPGPIGVVLDGLASSAVRVLVTVGPDDDPAALGSRPRNIRVERYVPQSLVFECCDLVICHGGSGTTLGALAFGLPLLCLPQGADQFLNATAVTSAGVGLAIPPDQLAAEAVAPAVARLLGERGFRDRARQVRDAILEMPTVDVVAGVLEGLM